MDKNEITRFVIPLVIIVIVILSVVILGGLASNNPDGFEWALFEFAGVSEPTSTFAGIWAFMGEGPVVEAVTGAIGVIIVLALGIILFKVLARHTP